MILDNDNGLLLMRHDHLGERSWRSDESYKLIFSPFGRGVYQTRHRDISIEKGECLIMNPFEKHKQLRAEKEKFLVELKPSFLKEAADQLNIYVSPEFSMLSSKHPQLQQWMTFVRDFLLLNEEGNPAINRFFLDNSLTQLSILMLQYGAGSHQVELPEINSREPVQTVVQALKESFREDWTLDEMARTAGLNKYQFAHLFKEELGLSPYSWLQLYRLIRSQHALFHTKESILWIALEYGFKSVSSYTHLVKKVYGKTPAEFRRIHGSNQ
ncbi:helix-turn-helix transcriptional regulator [Jeotgalibacillus proteolyticus]|uniref:helix-turn-helix transcriptional regulator n=1 Tax=Jeotgalibacillus proteolyticus TaxID=2082395 RepID=UPI003CF67E50